MRKIVIVFGALVILACFVDYKVIAGTALPTAGTTFKNSTTLIKLGTSNGGLTFNGQPVQGTPGPPGPAYTLPAATVSTLGGIKVGTGLAITVDGVLSNTGVAGVASFNGRGGAVTPQTGDYSAAQVTGISTVGKTGSYNDLSNKPTIPAAQVNSDWSAVSGVAQILNKPTIPAAQVNSDWNSSSGASQILNKPTVPTALSQLTEDATHRTVTDAEKDTWNSSAASVTSVNGETGTVVLTATDVGADTLGSATSVITNHESTYTHANIPTTAEKGAMVGTVGTPGVSNPFVTKQGYDNYSTAKAIKDTEQDSIISDKANTSALGTAAYTASTAYATAAQGALAGTAVQGSGVAKITASTTTPSSPALGDLWVDTGKAANPQRIVFFSDSHASLGNSYPSDVNTIATSRMVSAVSTLSPTHIIWAGDIINYAPIEWTVVKDQVDAINAANPSVKIHALMGNHDIIAYDFGGNGEPGNSFAANGGATAVPQEVSSYLATTAAAGATVITVDNAADFTTLAPVILIREPETALLEPDYFVSLVTSVNTTNNTITLTTPTDKEFAASTTAVRQGWSSYRGTGSFLKAFSGTDTTATNYYYTIGNNVFVMVSLAAKVSMTYNGSRDLLTAETFDWMERTIATFSETHNIFVVTHEPPETVTKLGLTFNAYNDYSPHDRSRFRYLCLNYPITAWIFGHNHPSAPHTDTLWGQASPQWGDTWFIQLPDLTRGFASADFAAGASSVDIKWYDPLTSTPYKTKNIPLPNLVAYEGAGDLKIAKDGTFKQINYQGVQPVGEASLNGQNMGSGEGIYIRKTGNALQFKSIKEGSNIALSADTDSVTVAVSGLAPVATSGSATDLTTGTLDHALLPALLSGDIPNNAANTTGTAAGVALSPGGGVVFPTPGSGVDVVLYNTSATANFAMATFYPNAGTNVTPAVKIIPKGTGSSATVQGRLQIYNTDAIADAANTEYLDIRGGGTVFNINANKGGTGSYRALSLGAGGFASALNINADGGVSVGSTGTIGAGNFRASQIISTVATGTAPLVVTSTTNVANLNASSLNGATFASPGAIGGTTPAAITGTTITATGKLSSLSTGETVKANGTCSTSINIDPDLGGIHTLTLSGACAIGVTNLTAGESFTLKLTQSSTTAPTFTSAYKWPNGTAPTWSTSATKYDVLSCYSDDGTTLLCNGMVDVR